MKGLVLTPPPSQAGFEPLMIRRCQDMIRAFEAAGVEMIEAHANLSETELARRLDSLRPDFVTAANFNYLLTRYRPGNDLDVLRYGVPIAVFWDDPFGALANFLGSDLSAKKNGVECGGSAFPAYVAPPAAFYEVMRHPLFLHFSWDSGHIETAVGLGLVDPQRVTWYPIATCPPFLEAPDPNANAGQGEIAFFGNVYPHALQQHEFYANPATREFTEEICRERIADLSAPVWDILWARRAVWPELAGMSRAGDSAAFWRFYQFLAWTAANAIVRLEVMKSAGRTVVLNGVFSDPKSREELLRYGNLKFGGNYDHALELPRALQEPAINLCLSNGLIQHGAPSKLIDTLASGGFALTDAKRDLFRIYGEPIREISFRTTDEMNAKIEYFLVRPQQRRELALTLREITRKKCTLENLARIMASAVENASVTERRSAVPEMSLPAHLCGAPPHAREDFLAQAFLERREELRRARAPAEALYRALRRHTIPADHPGDLPLRQWTQLMAFAFHFEPDLILEMGRGFGNSACAFTVVANLLSRPARVISLDLNDWSPIRERLRQELPDGWFDRLEPLQADILKFDFAAALGEAKRVLIFWDAHGFQIASAVLSRLLPLLATREHAVMMHDIGDTRYCDADTDYALYGVWAGQMDWPGPNLRLGNLMAHVPQVASAYDFASRNGLTLFSANHSLQQRFGHDGAAVKEITKDLGEDGFSLVGDWRWFTLQETSGPYVFPLNPSAAARKSRAAGAPYLSVALTARNGSDAESRRLGICIGNLLTQAERHRLPLELIVAEWNPPADRPPLAETLYLPEKHDYCSVRFINVPGEVHARYKLAGAQPLHRLLAWNVAFRRARGEFLLAAETDLLFSPELFVYLAQRKLQPGKLYRCDCRDADPGFPEDATPEEQLAYCGSHLRAAAVPQADGDIDARLLYGDGETPPRDAFLLLHRDDWSALRGYPEYDLAPQQLEPLFAAHAIGRGCEEVRLEPPLVAFRMPCSGDGEDGGSTSPRSDATVPDIGDESRRALEFAARRRGCNIQTNRPDWGLGDHQFAETLPLVAAWDLDAERLHAIEPKLEPQKKERQPQLSDQVSRNILLECDRYLEKLDLPGALEHLNRLTQEYRNWAPGYARLGVLLLATGDRAAAQKALRRALSLDSGDEDTVYHLATLIWDEGNRKEALKILERALVKYPERRRLAGILLYWYRDCKPGGRDALTDCELSLRRWQAVQRYLTAPAADLPELHRETRAALGAEFSRRDFVRLALSEAEIQFIRALRARFAAAANQSESLQPLLALLLYETLQALKLDAGLADCPNWLRENLWR